MKKPREVIKQLSPQDALAVLENLANSDDQLARRIAEIAVEYLREVDSEDVAADVRHALESLEVEDVWDQAGPSRNGYREPDEIADEMIGDTLEPHREDLSRYQRLNMLEEATCVCRGILSGLYLFEHESSAEFADWAVDIPVFYAEDTLEKWYTKDVPQEFVDEMISFIQSDLPKWKSLQRSLKKPPSTRR